VRERLGFGNTQLKVHLGRLEEMEYVLVHRDGQSASYELLYKGQGQDGQPFVCGLLDVEKLSAYDGERSAFSVERSGVGRPPVGAWSRGGRGEPIAVSPATGAAFVRPDAETSENALLEESDEIRRRTQDPSNGNGNGRTAEAALAPGR
jgi:hypothetical protein